MIDSTPTIETTYPPIRTRLNGVIIQESKILNECYILLLHIRGEVPGSSFGSETDSLPRIGP
jgi:hypothetical protein